jgi:hypothetical protein
LERIGGADRDTPEESTSADQGHSLRKFIPLPLRSGRELGNGARLALMTAGFAVIAAGIAIAVGVSQGRAGRSGIRGRSGLSPIMNTVSA